MTLAASGYFLAVLGAPLSWGRLWISLLAGALTLVIFATLCLRTWGMREDGDLAARAMCWIALG
ncbi:hypothetical protein OFN66_30900, partial [Escherichia coli]|nr:hypothetical protein [Escherichia coli]